MIILTLLPSYVYITVTYIVSLSSYEARNKDRLREVMQVAFHACLYLSCSGFDLVIHFKIDFLKAYCLSTNY